MLTTLLLWGLAVGAFAFVVYSFRVEPQRLTLTRVRASIPRLPAELEGLRLAHLSDLHIKGEHKPFPLQMARRAVALALEQRPDLVCLTGDLGQASRYIGLAARTLQPLTTHPTFTVMGNHDHDKMLESEFLGRPEENLTAEQWRAVAQQHGLQVLVNETARLQVRGRQVIIAGSGDPSCGWDDLPATLAEEPEGDLHLLLSHSPDIIDEPTADWADLVLCGHTHGGQAQLPWFGTVWAPVWRDRRRSDGLFAVGHTLCYVTRGVGAGIRARFLCRPEVCLLELTAGPGDKPRQLPRLPR